MCWKWVMRMTEDEGRRGSDELLRVQRMVEVEFAT
jgi:hypothetical protein